MDKKGIERYSVTRRIFCAVGKMQDSIHDPSKFGDFVRIAVTNAKDVLKNGVRLVMQCGEWRIEIHTDMLEEEEGIPSRLQPSAGVYIPKAEPSAERKKEDEEAGQGPDNHDGKAGHGSQGLSVEKGEKKKDSHSEMRSCGSHSKGGETLTGMAHMVRIAEKNVQVVEQEMTENGWTLSSQTNWDRPKVNVCTASGARTLHKHLQKKLEARKKELQKMKDDKKKVKPSAEENGMEAGEEEFKERDIEAKEEEAENDGSEEEAERSEKEKIFQKMKILQEKVREIAKQKEDIAATAFKQTDYLWNELHQRDASNACLKVIAKKAARLARCEKARVAMEKAISENLRQQLEKAKTEARDTVASKTEARDAAQVKEGEVVEEAKGAKTNTLPDTVENVSDEDRLGSDPHLEYINQCRQLYVRRRSGNDDRRPYLDPFDLKKEVLTEDGTVCKLGRFRWEDAQKNMDDRYYNCFTQKGTPNEIGDWGTCKKWRAAKWELSMDTAHVCKDALCHMILDYWRQQWLLRGGVQRGGSEYVKAKDIKWT